MAMLAARKIAARFVLVNFNLIIVRLLVDNVAAALTPPPCIFHFYQCGGFGCYLLPGGESSCCTSHVVKEGSCNIKLPPCNMMLSGNGQRRASSPVPTSSII